MDPIIITNYFNGSPDVAWKWGFAALMLLVSAIAGLGIIYTFTESKDKVGTKIVTVFFCTVIIACGIATSHHATEAVHTADRTLRAQLRDAANIETYTEYKGSSRSILATTTGGQTLLCNAFDLGKDQVKLICGR